MHKDLHTKPGVSHMREEDEALICQERNIFLDIFAEMSHAQNCDYPRKSPRTKIDRAETYAQESLAGLAAYFAKCRSNWHSAKCSGSYST